MQTFTVFDYDLDATLSSGQSFRWQKLDNMWSGVVASRCVRLQQLGSSITATVAEPVGDWEWLIDYLQLDVDLRPIIMTFPEDEPMLTARLACHGLRLLRQDAW